VKYRHTGKTGTGIYVCSPDWLWIVLPICTFQCSLLAVTGQMVKRQVPELVPEMHDSLRQLSELGCFEWRRRFSLPGNVSTEVGGFVGCT
jgi:hypothetical protein